MDYFIIFGLLGFGGMLFGFIGYKTVTGNIIKDLERENEILKTDNERLRTALAARKRPPQTKTIWINLKSALRDAGEKIMNEDPDGELFKDF